MYFSVNNKWFHKSAHAWVLVSIENFLHSRHVKVYYVDCQDIILASRLQLSVSITCLFVNRYINPLFYHLHSIQFWQLTLALARFILIYEHVSLLLKYTWFLPGKRCHGWSYVTKSTVRKQIKMNFLKKVSLLVQINFFKLTFKVIAVI